MIDETFNFFKGKIYKITFHDAIDFDFKIKKISILDKLVLIVLYKNKAIVIPIQNPIPIIAILGGIGILTGLTLSIALIDKIEDATNEILILTIAGLTGYYLVKKWS